MGQLLPEYSIGEYLALTGCDPSQLIGQQVKVYLQKGKAVSIKVQPTNLSIIWSDLESQWQNKSEKD